MGTLLVAERSPELRQMAALYLEGAGFKVLQAGSGEECLRLFDEHQPAVVLLDSGLALAGPLRALCARVGIILGTCRGDELECVASLESGADSCLAKPFNMRVLLAQVRSLLRRQVPLESGLLTRLGPYRVDLLRRRIVNRHGLDVPLTAGEFALLVGLIERRGQPVGRDELLACLRPSGESGDLRSVDTLIRRLRRKLEANANRPQLIQTVYGKGYRLGEGSLAEAGEGAGELIVNGGSRH